MVSRAFLTLSPSYGSEISVKGPNDYFFPYNTRALGYILHYNSIQGTWIENPGTRHSVQDLKDAKKIKTSVPALKEPTV